MGPCQLSELERWLNWEECPCECLAGALQADPHLVGNDTTPAQRGRKAQTGPCARKGWGRQSRGSSGMAGSQLPSVLFSPVPFHSQAGHPQVGLICWGRPVSRPCPSLLPITIPVEGEPRQWVPGGNSLDHEGLSLTPGEAWPRPQIINQLIGSDGYCCLGLTQKQNSAFSRSIASLSLSLTTGRGRGRPGGSGFGFWGPSPEE